MKAGLLTAQGTLLRAQTIAIIQLMHGTARSPGWRLHLIHSRLGPLRRLLQKMQSKRE